MANIDIYEDKAGEFRWRIESGSDVVADSGEGYSSKSDARKAAERVKKDAPGADVVETGTPHFDVFKDRAGEFRWRLVASNGRIVADSGEGYDAKDGAKEAIERIRKVAKATDIPD